MIHTNLQNIDSLKLIKKTPYVEEHNVKRHHFQRLRRFVWRCFWSRSGCMASPNLQLLLEEGIKHDQVPLS